MPCGQPGILLGQIIPEEISTLILDLEHEKMCKETTGSHAGGQTTILVDDSFLKNGKNLNDFSSPTKNILDLDEMNDIIPCLIKTEPKDETENLNDSGIVIDTKVDESAVAPQPSVSSTPAVQTVPEKKHQCQFCQKPYQSISGLKYHLKKASNECSIKFKAKTILN